MGKRMFEKSTFSKLYLIDEETYNRITAQLTELERQDLEDLNIENGSDSALKDDASEMKSATPEIDTESAAKLADDDINNQEVTKNFSPEESSVKTRKMKPKRFACSICITKKFTTKSSLKRHHRLFHEQKQFIKTEEQPLEAETLPSKERELDNDFALSRGLKRKALENLEQTPEKKFRSEAPVRGVKRKALASSRDTEPQKKFHWSSF